MSSKISKSGGVNSKVLMTKWDMTNVERLTRSDFYNDHFQPRESFLIPHGVSYPNERTMIKAMNEIQKGLKNGGKKEWRIIQWRRGARMVRLVDPADPAGKDRKPAASSADVIRENDQLRSVKSDLLQRTESTTEAKSSEAPSTSNKVPRSIFTVQDKPKVVQGDKNHTQEAKTGSSPARSLGQKGMEKCDLEMAIHGLEDFEQYTHEQLQKILDVNKRFFQLSQQGNPPKQSPKQIKNVTNSEELPKRNKRSERDSFEQTMGENVCNELDVKDNVRSEMKAKKKSVSQDNKKREPSDGSSDEKYVFADYQENSESSLFDSDCNTCEDLAPESDPNPKTVATSVKTDKLSEIYIPPVHRSQRGSMGTGDQIGMPGSKLKKKFPTGGVILNDIESDAGPWTGFSRDDQSDKPRSKSTKRFSKSGVTVNEIEESGGEMVGRDVKPPKRGASTREKKSVSVAASRCTVITPRGHVYFDTRSSAQYSRKTLRKEAPATSTIGSSHAVNQRKKNLEIDRENNRLSITLERIKTSPPKNSISFRMSRQEQLPFARIQRRISKKSIFEQY